MMHLAILGNGMIVGEALHALQYIDEIHVAALWSRERSRSKSEALAAEYHIDGVYTDYSALLSSGEIDTVYVGLVNSVHYQYARLALLAGKHVILEKPSCTSRQELDELCRIASDRHLFLWEAVTFLHAPYFARVRSAKLSLGPVRLIQCNYSKYSSRYDRYLHHDIAPAFDPACQGGALLDLNIYNLNFVISLFGPPERISYFPNVGYNGIDISGVAHLGYPGFQCVCSAAKDSSSPNFMQIQGEKGWLRLVGSPDNFKQLEVFLNGQLTVTDIRSVQHRMIDEFRDFEHMLSTRDFRRMQQFLTISQEVAAAAEAAHRDF